MVRLTKYIVQLLHDHDCVIIPEFGGFVAQYKPASLDRVTGFYSPPSKQILFNINLKNNDGLLANIVAQEQDISFQRATQVIADFVTTINKELKEKKTFQFIHLGTLFYENNALMFKQKSDNFLGSSFGLPPINVNEFKSVESQINEPTKVFDVAPKMLSTNTKWWVAAAIVPILFYSAWIPLKTDLLNNPSNFSYSDLNPFTYSKEIKTGASFNKVNYKDVETTNNISITSNNTIKEIDRVENSTELSGNPLIINEEPIHEVKALATPKYHVIVGCFGNPKNSSRLIKKLNKKGYKAYKLDVHKNLHRVALATYDQKEDAILAQIQIKEEEKMSSWVLTK